MRGKFLLALGGSLLVGIVGVVNADATLSSADLQSEMATLKARIVELEAKQGDQWLNERRAEEIKTLVRDVLSDADTRASLMAEGMTAGHDGKHFFLASADGSFLMNLSGQIQARYIYNNRDGKAQFLVDEDGEVLEDDDGNPILDPDSMTDENENGFQMRRIKLQIDGHIASPRLGYVVRLAANRNTNVVGVEEARISYELADGLTLAGGRFKAPLLREELVSSSKQLTVERSLVNEIFTAGYVEGVSLTYATDMIKITGMINDGILSGEIGGPNDFQNDATDVALTGRVDVKLAGDWSQWGDMAAWDGEEMAAFVGAAVHYQLTESGDFGPAAPDRVLGYDSLIIWTVDGSIEMTGLNIYGAIIGAHTDGTDAGANTDNYGAVVQAGYMIIPDTLEPFIRYEWADLDDEAAATDDVHILTFGANYYLAKHNAKFTMDLLWSLEPLSPNNINGVGTSGLGLLNDNFGEEDQLAIRAQFQLLF